MTAVVNAWEQRNMPDSLKGIKIVDVDTHYTEPPDLWTSRAPATMKDHVPHVRRVEGIDQWWVGDQPMGGVSITIISKGAKKEHGSITLPTYDEVDPSTWDTKARLAAMDARNIWGEIVFPNAAGFGGGTVQNLVAEKDRNEIIRIYNDAIAEWSAGSDGRLNPQALLPFWDIPESVKEVERIRKLGLTGVACASAPETYAEDYPDYGHSAWEPFWEVIEATDTPISLHIGGGNVVGGSRWKSFGLDLQKAIGHADTRGSRSMAPVAVSALQASLLNASPMANLIYSGLFDRHPKVKFASIESGLAWLPFFIEMLDYQFDEFTTGDNWGLQRRPSEYFRDHFYTSFWFEKFAVQNQALLDFVGVGKVLFETDFPHPTCLYPDPVSHVAEVFAPLAFETKKKILQDNAADLWKLKV